MLKDSRQLFLVVLCALLTLTACNKRSATPEQADVATPDGAVMVAVRALRSGDFHLFLKESMTKAEYAEARQEWDTARQQPLEPAEEAELNATLMRINSDDAVEQIMSEIEPQLLEVRDKLPMLLGLAQTFGHAGISNNDELTDSQKQTANELLGAVGRWAGGRDLADPALARKAVTIGVEAGRSLELEQASDLKSLEFEDMVGRAGTMFTASKQMLQVYGIDINKLLDSVTAETLSQDGDQATVRVRFSFLDTKQKIDMPMVRINGRWLSKDAVNSALKKDSASSQSDSTDTET